MLRSIAAVLISTGGLSACSPTLNWREVRAEPADLKAMLPCKPDKGARTVAMAGREVSLQVLGCDTGGATFAVMFADVADASRLGEVLTQWKAASLSNMRATVSKENPFRPPGALGLPQSLQVAASGTRADGSKVESQATYFAQGKHVFQAVIYAVEIKPEMAEPFFSGLRFE